jgi:aryl-alcohol dehydrogenase-like predicted oxidoreductase
VRLVHRALDLGVAFFDTADSYGDGSSEAVLGLALRGRRDAAVLATKVGYLFQERGRAAWVLRRAGLPLIRRAYRAGGFSTGASRATTAAYGRQDFSVMHLRSALEDSLRRLRTDYVDLYQLHGPPGVCDDQVIELLSDLRTEGKIRGFGVGLESLNHALDWANTRALSGIQLPYGILDPEAATTVIPAAVLNSLPVIVRGAFASGLLTRSSASDRIRLRRGQHERRSAVHAMAARLSVPVLQLATWFVTTTPGVTTLLVGTTSDEHLRQVSRFLEVKPPRDIRARLADLPGLDTGTPDTEATGPEAP